MNEEEVKGKLLLPYLSELGFSPAEIALETSFSIRLGRFKKPMNGRSDILCTRNGKNLFIIELKKDGISISQDDIDQGISYARALDQIAPFTLVSNGKTVRIFDSITKAELTDKKLSDASDYWKSGYTLSGDAELALRYEALKNFVSLSAENLQDSCKQQVQDRMGGILGDVEAPGAKFVKALHIQRMELQSVFKRFMDVEAKTFAIVGCAGVGKTNAMCALALQSLEDQFVFFYNAAIIMKSPLEYITQDLNGVFSAKSDSDLVLKKLDELGRISNKKVLLFIDGVDECINPAIAFELGEIALAIRHLSHVKLCLSCKDNIWLGMIDINGNRTALFEELMKFESRLPGTDKIPGYLLKDFSDEELREVIPVYKQFFDFKGDISDELLQALKNGFFLRIFSEVYSGQEVPILIDDQQLIYAYLQQSLNKAPLGFHKGIRILAEIGQVLLDYNYTAMEAHEDDGIEAWKVINGLNLGLDKEVPEDLFTRNILTRSNKKDSYHISFYYSKIRDYVIAFHTYRLQDMRDEEFSGVLEKFYENYIGQSAIAFYIANASWYHQQAVINFKISKANSYLVVYNRYLEAHFKSYKRLFDPHTNGDIGMILPVDTLNRDGYALYPLTAENPDKIIFEDIGFGFSENNYHSRPYQLGAQRIYGSNISLLVTDQDMVAGENIFKDLKEIIEKGRLNAFNSDALLLEQLALIIYYNSKELFFDTKFADQYLPRFAQIYPIDLSDIKNRIRRFRAVHHYRMQRLAPDIVDKLVEEALLNGTEMPDVNIMGDFPPMEHLSKIISALQQKGYQVIEKHYLPYPDRSVQEARIAMPKNNRNEVADLRIYQYSPEQAKQYIISFFKDLEVAYKDFVEELFPTLKNRFEFYKGIPHDYFFYMQEADILKHGSFGYRPSANDQPAFYFEGQSAWDKPFKVDKVRSVQGFSLDLILHSHYHRRVKTVDRVNTPKVDDFSILRYWVYSLLRNDMKEIFKENGSQIQ